LKNDLRTTDPVEIDGTLDRLDNEVRPQVG